MSNVNIQNKVDYSKEAFDKQNEYLKKFDDILYTNNPDIYDKIDDQRVSFENWKLSLPKYAFYPDEWTVAFQKGLKPEYLKGKNVYEVGIGTGTNGIHLINIGAEKVYGSDIEGKNGLLAGTNIYDNLGSYGVNKFEAFLGEKSLLEPLFDKENEKIKDSIEEIVACIPQAILPKNVEKHPDDKAHYYPAELFEDYQFNKYALGLNDALLAQSKEITPSANVTLNLGGRIGLEKLKELFTLYGYIPEIIHSEIIPQCPSTNLSFFVDLEKNGELECEFFIDKEGKEKISAQEAEIIRAGKKKPVYHAIYVIRGIPEKSNKEDIKMENI